MEFCAQDGSSTGQGEVIFKKRADADKVCVGEGLLKKKIVLLRISHALHRLFLLFFGGAELVKRCANFSSSTVAESPAQPSAQPSMRWSRC
jgi:hypothetical protein